MPIFCTHSPNGYSKTNCDALNNVSKPFSDNATGILSRSLINKNTGDNIGKQFSIVPNVGVTPLVMSVCPFCSGLLRDVSMEELEYMSSVHEKILKSKKAEILNKAGLDPDGQNLSRCNIREELEKAGVTAENITTEQISDLMAFLRVNLKNSKAYDGTLQLVNRKASRNLFVRSKSWPSREAISFNDDFIGFAGWADNKNVQPILAGVKDWLTHLACIKRKG